MNELKLQDQSLDSRNVAEMMEVEHRNLIRKIKQHIEYLIDGEELKIEQSDSNQLNFAPVDFFSESSYLDEKREERLCYQVTRMGCELLAHKMTGRKGTQFTAKYIQKFHTMEKHLISGISIAEIKASMETIADDIFQRKANEISTEMKEYYRPSHAHKIGIGQYIKNRLGVGATHDEFEMVKQRVLIKLDASKWEDIPVDTLRDSLNTIDESIRVVKLDRQVNQISLFE